MYLEYTTIAKQHIEVFPNVDFILQHFFLMLKLDAD